MCLAERAPDAGVHAAPGCRRQAAPAGRCPPRRLASLACHGTVSKAPVLGRLATDRKAATLLATVRHLLAVAIDDALDLFDVLMSTRLLARAERATAKERARSLPRLARASATLASVVEALMAVAETGEALSIPELWDRLGRPPKDHRLIVEAIVWLDRTGAPWRDLPAHFGPWGTVASRFYRWRRRGVWDRVVAALQAQADARGELDWLLHYVDGSVVRAHQHAAGPGASPPRPTWTGGLPPILTSRATGTGIGIGRRWAAAAAATPPSCTCGSRATASRW